MAETGILYALERRYRMTDVCSTPMSATRAQALELSEVCAAFVVLASGITASMIVLFIEMYCRDSIPVQLVPLLLNKLRTVKHFY